MPAEKGEALAKEFGIKFIETSAKTPKNVDEAFTMISREILPRLIAGGTAPALTGPPSERNSEQRVSSSGAAPPSQQQQQQQQQSPSSGTVDIAAASKKPAGEKKKGCC